MTKIIGGHKHKVVPPDQGYKKKHNPQFLVKIEHKHLWTQDLAIKKIKKVQRKKLFYRMKPKYLGNLILL